MSAAFVRSNVVRQTKPQLQQPPLTHTTATSPFTTDHAAQPPSTFQLSTSSSTPSTTPPPSTPSPPALPLPGTRAWLNSLTFVSSGVVDLDHLLGGGLFLHTLTSITEDAANHTSPFVRCFAADAFHHAHSLITISSSPSAHSLLSCLPTPASASSSSSAPTAASPLKIAWRYSSPSSSPSSSPTPSATPHLPPRTSLSPPYNLHILRSPPPLSSPTSPHHHHLHAHPPHLYRFLYQQLATLLSSLPSTTVTRVLVQGLGDVDWGYSGADEVSRISTHTAPERG